MNSSTYVLIVCVTVSYMEQILSVGKPEDFKTIKANIEEMNAILRNKRMSRFSKTFGAALDIGDKAVKTLLKGTKEVPSAKHKLRNFVKNGNYNDALRDFRKVQPRNVHSTRGYNGELRMIGEIGDRTIILTQGKYRKNGKAVTIELIKSKYLESGIERITYIDRNKL